MFDLLIFAELFFQKDEGYKGDLCRKEVMYD